MKKIFCAIFYIYLTVPASAMVTPVLYSDFSTAASNTATNYVAISGGEQSWGATETPYKQPIPVKGTLRKLYVVFATAPGAGASRTITLRQNTANSALTCTVSGAATSCSDNADQISVAPGDLVDYSSVPAGTPAASTVNIYLEYYSSFSRESILLGGASQNVNNTTRYLTLMGMGNDRATAEINAQEIVSTPGTLRNFYISLAAAPGAGNSYTFTVRQNAANTAITCTVTGAGTPAACNDTTHNITIAAGDKIDFSSVPASGPTATTAASGIEFDPNTDGNSMLGGATGTANVVSRTVNNFAALQDGCDSLNNFDATEANVQDSVPVITLSNFYVAIATAPGAAKSFQFAIRDNSVTKALSVTISGAAATSGNDTTDKVTFGINDTADIISIPTGTPATQTYVGWGLTMYYSEIFDAKLLSGD